MSLLETLKAAPDGRATEIELGAARITLKGGKWLGDGASQQRTISAEIAEAHLGDGVHHLTDALGISDKALPPLPDWITAAERIELSQLFAVLEQSGTTTEVIAAGFGLRLAGSWTIVEHFLTASDLQVFFAVSSPENAAWREIELSVSGTLGFAGAQIAISATATLAPVPDPAPGAPALRDALRERGIEIADEDLKDLDPIKEMIAAEAEALEAGLAPPPKGVFFAIEGKLLRPVRFADAMRHFGWAPGGPLAELQIDALTFRADTGASTFAFLLNVGTDPEGLPVLDGKFHLERIFVSVNGGAGGGIGGTLGCKVKIGDVTIDLQAECDLADGGWRFDGEAEIPHPHPESFLQDIRKKFSITLPDLVTGIEEITAAISFDTGSREFTASLHGRLKLSEATEAEIRMEIDIAPDGDGWSVQFSGALDLASSDGEAMRFDLTIDASSSAGATLVAVYADDDPENKHDLATLAARLAGIPAERLPKNLSLRIPGAVFAHRRGGPNLLAFDLEGGFDLGAIHLPDLPLVSAVAGTAPSARLAFQVVLSDTDLGPDNALRATIAAQGFTLGAGEIKSPVTLAARLQLGAETHALSVPVEAQKAAFSDDLVAKAAEGGGTVQQVDHAHWIDLHRKLGPLRFERIGIAFETVGTKGPEVAVLLDAGFEVAGLRVSLDGLAMRSGLKDFSPAFSLSGLGIDYRNPAIEIGGGLLLLAEGRGFAGTVIARSAEFTLTAMGAFSQIDKQPTLFVYATLDHALGGPPFFFVTGLAAGFGYNRDILMPEAEGVEDFPLVKWAKPGGASTAPKDPLGALRELGRFIPPALGSAFVALGVAFTSFKVTESFALLVGKFGHKLEFDLLGTSRLTSPPAGTKLGQPPVAQATLGLRARFVPEDGILSVRAVLGPDSFVLSRDCHLGGGFAFSAWFKKLGEIEAGDFVITLGGYHALFVPPPHYPLVPRLSVQWRVSPNLTIKGSAYFAVTGGAVMAGGRFEAVWQSGDVRAAFIAATDFLLTWKPYHYDISVRVFISAEVTIHIFGTHHLTFDAGADVHMWGPEFSGVARLHLKVIGFDVAFDVRFGDGTALAQPIGWDEFRDSFLPAEPCTITARAGLLGTMPAVDGQPERWIVSGHAVVLAFETAIPLSAMPSTPPGDGARKVTRPAVAPVALHGADFVSTITVTVKRDGKPFSGICLVPVRKAMPAGLWGEPRTRVDKDLHKTYLEPAGANDPRFVADLLAGVVIAPSPNLGAGQPPEGGRPSEVEATVSWDPQPEPLAKTAGESPRTRRNNMLRAMGMRIDEVAA